MQSKSHELPAVILVALLLPILILSMLPSIIFGPILSDGSGKDNGFVSEAAMLTNMEDINLTLQELLSKGLKKTLQSVERDFLKSGMDRKVIINQANADADYNANRFISMYCAKMHNQVDKINLDDMHRIIEEHIDNLYSFTFEDSEETVCTGYDTEGNEATYETVTVRTYTVFYNGEEYFADEIFELSDQQKLYAEEYTKNLSILFCDGIYQVQKESGGIKNYGDIQLSGGKGNMVYYNQRDERWTTAPYGTDDLGSYGCGPTCMAMVISSLTNETITPREMAEWAYENGYWCRGNGSYRSLISGAAKAWGLSVASCGRTDSKEILQALKDGKLVVALETKGHFTSSGHFIVLRGIDNQGSILIADPASYDRTQKAWSLMLILSEASRKNDTEGPLWIIG